MTPRTNPYRLLAPALGHPIGAVLVGYPWSPDRVELLCNGRRDVVARSLVELFKQEIAAIEAAKPTAREEEYQEAKP